jgi:plasmid stabilization system protein ParE
VARWSPEAELDLDAIRLHQEHWNGAERADEICHWLLDFAETIEPRHWPDAPVAHAKKVIKNGYVFLVREADGEAQIIGVFGPGMNWTSHAGER